MKHLKSSSGLSLIEILIGFGLMSILTVSFMYLSENQLKSNNFLEFQVKKNQLQNIINSQFLSNPKNCECLFASAAPFNANPPLPHGVTLTGSNPTQLGLYNFITPGNCATASIAQPWINTTGIDGLKLSAIKVTNIVKNATNYNGEFEVDVTSTKNVNGPKDLKITIPILINTVPVGANVKLLNCANRNAASVAAIINPNTGYDGQTGLAACQAMGKTCQYVQSYNTVKVDVGCAGATHCVNVCLTMYNTSLPGVPNGVHNNLFSCAARVGEHATYLHPGVVQCNGFFSAVCM